jgi:hypothetical protein
MIVLIEIAPSAWFCRERVQSNSAILFSWHQLHVTNPPRLSHAPKKQDDQEENEKSCDASAYSSPNCCGGIPRVSATVNNVINQKKVDALSWVQRYRISGVEEA